MGSKKGVGITVGILVAITIASFMVWFANPSNNSEMTIVVTDFENHDAGIVERHKIVSNSVEDSSTSILPPGKEWYPGKARRYGWRCTAKICCSCMKITETDSRGWGLFIR